MAGTDSFCCFSLKPKLRAIWELTGICNLRCLHCHRTNFTDYGLSTEEALNAIDVLGSVGVQNVIFSGGEPTLRKDIFILLEHAYKKIGDLDICTNATTIRRKEATQLARFLGEISVTLNGFPAAHDYICGHAGAFEKTTRGIQSLVKAGLEVHLIYVPFKGINDKDIIPFIDTIIKLGIHSISFLRLLPLGKGKRLSRYLMNAAHRDKFMKNIKQARKKYPNFPINTKRIAKQAPLGQCPAGKYLLGINTNGTTTTCPIGGKLIGTTNDLLSWKPSLLNAKSRVCQRCPLNVRCQGGCPAEGQPDILCIRVKHD